MSLTTKDKVDTTQGIIKKEEQKSPVKNPHDIAFKVSMKELSVAKEMINTYYPETVLKQLNLDTLKVSPSSYISPRLMETHSDMLYTVETIQGDACCLYLLWEHQSTYDPNMHLRLLEYTCRILEDHRAKNGKRGKKLPIVLPALVYNGIQSPYPGNTNLMDEFENPVLAQKLMFKSINLVDLTTKTDDEIMSQHQWASLTLLILKHMRDKNFMDCQPLINASLHFLWQEDNGRLLALILVECIIKTTSIAEKEAFAKDLSKTQPEIGEYIMTLYQQLTEEGRQEGRQEGIDLGRQEGIDIGKHEAIDETIRSMFLNNMDATTISKILKDVSPQRISAIKASIEAGRNT